MARHSLRLAGSPLHFRAFFFFNVRPHVILVHGTGNPLFPCLSNSFYLETHILFDFDLAHLNTSDLS